MKLTVQDIMNLMDKLSQTNLGEITLNDDDGFSLSIKAKKPKEITVASSAPVQAVPVSPVQPAVSAAPQESAQTAEEQSGNVVKSPIVGTFYASPSPDKPPFVTVGSQVKKGDVLFIIESMKLMNEVTSEFDGTVKSILAENGTGVEYNQDIMIIE